MAKRCRNDTSAEDPNKLNKKRLRSGAEICSRSDLCGSGEIKRRTTTTIEEDKAYLVGLASEIEEKNSQLKAAQQLLEEERRDLRQQRDLFEARWQLLDDERAAQDILLGAELKRCNHQQDLLSKERQDLKLERETFERQWDMLDAKRDETAQDLTRMAHRKDALSADCTALSRQRDTLAADCASLQNQMRAAHDSLQKALQHLQFSEDFNQMAKGFKDRAALLDQASLRFTKRLDNAFLHSIPIFIPIPISNAGDSVDSFNKLFANTISTQTTLHSLALQLRKKTDEVKLEQLRLHKELKSLCNLTTTTTTPGPSSDPSPDPAPAPATDPTTGGEECVTADDDQHAQHILESELKNLLKECNHLHQLLFKERHALTTVKDNFQRRWQLLNTHAPGDDSTLLLCL